MNITTRAEFDRLLQCLREAHEFAVDSETNGLKVFEGNRPISFSFYFPESDESFNFAFAHGEGEIFVPQSNRNMAKFHNWNWTGKGKKQAYKRYWWELFKETADFGNLPNAWLEELRDVWNRVVASPLVQVVYFNAPFDIHMMSLLGFVQPATVEDVYIAVNLVFEDWNSPSVGGEAGLKWQAAYHKIPGALDGEHDLRAQADKLAERLAIFISERWDDPINSSFHLLKRPARVDEIAKRVTFDAKSEMWCLPASAVARYAENDTVITWKLREHLRGILVQWHQWQLYLTLCAVQAEVAIAMERNGILLDKNRAIQLMDEMGPLMDAESAWFVERLQERWDTLSEDVQRELTDSRGRLSFTLGSSKKLPVALTVLTGHTWVRSDKEAVEKFEEVYGEHEAVERLKRFRHAQRAVSTYLRNWVRSVDEQGYIHMSFNVTGTKTGRWSSSSGTLGDTGNGQNIPSRGFLIKEALITPPGWKMFQIDQGQIELRLGAWIAGCETMIRLFESGEDMHAYTRDQAGVRDILFAGQPLDSQIEELRRRGKLKEDPTTEAEADAAVLDYCRQVAKTLNFGLLYAGSWRMVARLLKLDEEQSRALHSAWNRLYPEFAQANEDWTRQALTRRERPDGSGRSLMYVVQPLSNRTRKFGFYPLRYDFYDSDGKRQTINPRERAAKDAFNFAVQGGAAYIMGVSGLHISRLMPSSVYRPFAFIHDSLNFYLREDALQHLDTIVFQMTDWPVRPRLTVDVEYAADGSWQHMRKVTDLSLFIQSGGNAGYKGA